MSFIHRRRGLGVFESAVIVTVLLAQGTIVLSLLGVVAGMPA
jgi:hypothetical protein